MSEFSDCRFHEDITGGGDQEHECKLNLMIPCGLCPIGLGVMDEDSGLDLVRSLLSQRDGWEMRHRESESLRKKESERSVVEVEKMQDQIEEMKTAYVPQENALAMMARLTAAGYDVPGRPNTLWAMVLSVCEDVERLRSADHGTAGYESAAMFRDQLKEEKVRSSEMDQSRDLVIEQQGRLLLVIMKHLNVTWKHEKKFKKTLGQFNNLRGKKKVQSGSAPAETLPGESATARSPLPSQEDGER